MPEWMGNAASALPKMTHRTLSQSKNKNEYNVNDAFWVRHPITLGTP